MAHAAYLREKARELRRERSLTIDELAERLALSRSTIYYWVRDLPISASGPGGGWASTTAQRRGTLAMQSKYRRLREEAYVRGQAEFTDLARDPCFRDFVCLYLAEGYKRDRNVVSICNSDPAIMALGDASIRRFTRSPIAYAVQYHVDQEPDEVAAFWASQLSIDTACVRLHRKTNSAQLSNRSWRCEHGVLAITSSDTCFRPRLQAWMDAVRLSWV